MRVPDFVSGLLILAFGLWSLIVALGFPSALGQSIGPGTFPVVISSALALGGLLLVAGSLRLRLAGRRQVEAPGTPKEGTDAATLLVMAVIIAMPLFYVFAADPLGSLLTSFIVLFTTTLVLWGGWVRVTLFSLAGAVFIDGIFRGLFGIPMEPGILSIPWW